MTARQTSNFHIHRTFFLSSIHTKIFLKHLAMSVGVPSKISNIFPSQNNERPRFYSNNLLEVQQRAASFCVEFSVIFLNRFSTLGIASRAFLSIAVIQFSTEKTLKCKRKSLREGVRKEYFFFSGKSLYEN